LSGQGGGCFECKFERDMKNQFNHLIMPEDTSIVSNLREQIDRLRTENEGLKDKNEWLLEIIEAAKWLICNPNDEEGIYVEAHGIRFPVHRWRELESLLFTQQEREE